MKRGDAKKSKMSPAQQVKAFRDAARELGCDDDEKAFDEVLKKASAAPPPKTVQRRKNSKSSRKP